MHSSQKVWCLALSFGDPKSQPSWANCDCWLLARGTGRGCGGGTEVFVASLCPMSFPGTSTSLTFCLSSLGCGNPPSTLLSHTIVPLILIWNVPASWLGQRATDSTWSSNVASISCAIHAERIIHLHFTQ